MKDMETILEITKQVNTALETLNQMGVKFSGVLDIPILLKALKVI